MDWRSKYHLATVDTFAEATKAAPPEQRADPDWWMLVCWKVGEALGFADTFATSEVRKAIYQKVDAFMQEISPREFLMALHALRLGVRDIDNELRMLEIVHEPPTRSVKDELREEWLDQHRARLSVLHHYFDLRAGIEATIFGYETAREVAVVLQRLRHIVLALPPLNG